MPKKPLGAAPYRRGLACPAGILKLKGSNREAKSSEQEPDRDPLRLEKNTLPASLYF